jgi:hypothetical protein
METAVIVRGRISNSRHIELDEPVADIDGEVEIVLRRIKPPAETTIVDVFDLIATSAPGMRTKEDIDRQLADERSSWGER